MENLKVIDVWADWCGPCKRFAPIFEKVAVQWPDIAFQKIEADTNPSFLVKYGIQHIPTVLILRNDQVVFQHKGILSEAALNQAIKSVV